jgi:HSP20 family molecular chaperone IbpA
MSTRHSLLGTANTTYPLDIFFNDLFKTGTMDTFESPTLAKISHPVDIFESDSGLHLEIACTGLTRDMVEISIQDHDILRVKYEKPSSHSKNEISYIHRGISKKSFNIAYKVSTKYDMRSAEASMKNGLLEIFIPFEKEAKPRFLTIS